MSEIQSNTDPREQLVVAGNALLNAIYEHTLAHNARHEAEHRLSALLSEKSLGEAIAHIEENALESMRVTLAHETAIETMRAALASYVDLRDALAKTETAPA